SKFTEYGREMVPNGYFRYAQSVSNLFVGATLADKNGHLELPVCQVIIRIGPISILSISAVHLCDFLGRRRPVQGEFSIANALNSPPQFNRSMMLQRYPPCARAECLRP